MPSPTRTRVALPDLPARSPSERVADPAGGGAGVQSQAPAPAQQAPDAHEVAELAIVEAARRGSPDACTALMARHYEPLLRYVHLFCRGDAAAAEDIAQEAWWRIVRALPRLKRLDRFFGWACVIARREATRWRQRRARQPLVLHTLPPVAIDGPAEQIDRVEAVREALRRLPERFRIPLVLELWEGLSIAEIAAQLAVPQGTVKSRLARGRARIKALWPKLTGQSWSEDEAPDETPAEKPDDRH